MEPHEHQHAPAAPHAHPQHHGHHADPAGGAHAGHRISPYRMAFQATWHCLLGCGIGEVVGMSISMALGWALLPSIALSVGLGFVFGFALGVVPWLREGYPLGQALKAVLVAEGLSIVVMEAAEVLTQVYVPGVLDAHVDEPLFWAGMALALAVGFTAAYPVNLWMIRRGVVHRH